MSVTVNIWKHVWILFGGFFGWFIAEFKPVFPLAVVAVILIMYDAFTAYKLDVRAHKVYPDKTKRHKAKFTSFQFGKVIKKTLPNRLWLIFLSYLVEHWVFIHVHIPLSYFVTGAICFEQFWSILENESSCRQDGGKFFKMLQRIMIDKTSRHFDIDPHNLDLSDNKNDKEHEED